MELSAVINKRVSIRKFDDREVSLDLVMKVLESGNKAPTAGNVQPWEFVIVTDKDKKKDIVNATYVGAEIHSNKTQEWMHTAPVFIVVCGDRQRIISKYGEEGADILLYMDCSACIQNMLLAIVDIGLSSCYVTGFREGELREVIDLPDGILPVAILPIGYGTADEGKKAKKLDVMSKIHYDTF